LTHLPYPHHRIGLSLSKSPNIIARVKVSVDITKYYRPCPRKGTIFFISLEKFISVTILTKSSLWVKTLYFFFSDNGNKKKQTLEMSD